MRRVPLLPNVITAFGLTCGLFAIFKTNMTPIGEVNYPLLLVITGFLLMAAFADLLDGAVARALKAESAFGGYFDSIADAISFGVAPSIIVLKSLSAEPGTDISFLMTTAALVYSVSGVLRLVRFNVTNQEVKGDILLEAANKSNFTGLPIPAAAAAAISTNLLLASDGWKNAFDDVTRAWLLFFSMSILGYLMISRLKFPSIKTLHIRVGSFRLVFLTVIVAVVLFYGLLNYFPVLFFTLSWGYIVTALSLLLIHRISGRRLKTLEEFEPEPDDLEE